MCAADGNLDMAYDRMYVQFGTHLQGNIKEWASLYRIHYNDCNDYFWHFNSFPLLH